MHLFLPVLSILLTSFHHGNAILPSYMPVLSVESGTPRDFELVNQNNEHAIVINTRSGKVQAVSQNAAEHSPVFVPCQTCKIDEKKVLVEPTVEPIGIVLPTGSPSMTIMPEPSLPQPIDPLPCDPKWQGPGIEHPMQVERMVMPCPIIDNDAI
jgi:hypothetical protein